MANRPCQVNSQTLANLQRAVDSYKSALEVYTRESFPAEWVTTQLDLGEAYV